MDVTLAKEIVNLQDKLNCKFNPEWKTSNQDWVAAMMIEAVEAYDSTAWKWWKKQEVDKDNLIVEAVDIFHFLLSLTIERSLFKEVSGALIWLSSIEIPAYPIEQDIGVFREELKHFIATCPTEDTDTLWKIWKALWLALGKTMDDIAKEYLVKNLLNIFRQEHGYKEGSYHKIWVDINTGLSVEDNVVAYEIADSLELDENFTKELQSKLEEAYKEEL